jgi:hypothetical protein
LLQCEIDASFFIFYDLNRSEMEHILDSFNLVRDRDSIEYGEYRSKRIILEIHDAMAEAARTGIPYANRLVELMQMQSYQSQVVGEGTL